MNYHEDVKAFVDGELEASYRAEMEAAMEKDADLREEIEAMRALGFELKRAAVKHPATGAEKAIGRNLRRPWGWRLMTPAIGLAAVAILAIAFGPGGASSRFKGMAEASTAIAAQDSEMSTGGSAMAGDQGLAVNGTVTGRDPTLRTLPGKHYGAPTEPEADTNGVAGPTLNPDLIRTASISMRVASASEALDSATALAKRMGGFYEASRINQHQGESASADVTLRVPVTMFDATLKQLRKIGEVLDQSSNSQDVTAQIADVGARLKVLRAEEESYVTMLRAGRKVGEILEIKDRLSTVRQEIESLTAQQKALKNQSSYSTIACSFQEKPKVEAERPPKDWSEDTWANAVNNLKDVGRFLGQALIFIFVFAPIWLPVLLVGLWISRKRNP